MTALYIILAVILLILLLLIFLSVDLIILADTKNGFIVKVCFLGKIFEGNDTPQDKPNALFEKLKQFLGISHLDSADAVKDSISKKGTINTAKKTFSVFKDIIDRIIWLFKRCRLMDCRITSISGGDDAAINYGIACAAVYPIVAYIQNVMSIKKNAINLDLRCDYDREESENGIYAVIRIRILNVLRAFLYLARKNLMR